MNRIVQRSVAATGVDPGPYSAHSLRAGLATAAAEAGVSERAIMAQTGHRSLTVARGYIREGSFSEANCRSDFRERGPQGTRDQVRASENRQALS